MYKNLSMRRCIAILSAIILERPADILSSINKRQGIGELFRKENKAVPIHLIVDEFGGFSSVLTVIICCINNHTSVLKNIKSIRKKCKVV